MCWSRFLFFLVLLCAQANSGWPQTRYVVQQAASYEPRRTKTNTSSGVRRLRRSRRDLGTIKVSTPAYYSTYQPDFSMSTIDNNIQNRQVTREVTTTLQTGDKRSTYHELTRSANLLIDSEVYIKVTSSSSSTGANDGYTEKHITTEDTVQWLNDSVTGTTPLDVSLIAISETKEDPEITDATNTDEQNIRNTTSAKATGKRLIADYMSYKIAKAINIYVQPIITVVGVVGNTISMIVMFQRNNRQTSFGIYLGMLAVSDTLALCVTTGYWLERKLSSSPLRDIDCQTRGWAINALQMNGLFLILSLTFDRLISVRFPLKAVAWCNARRAKHVSAAIFVVVWLVNAPYFVFAHVENRNMCAVGSPGSMVSFVFPWIVVCVGLVVPFLLLVSMNAVIAIAIRNRLRYRAKYAPDRRRDTDEPIEMRESQSGSSQEQQQDQSRQSNWRILPMSSRDRNAIVTLFLVSFTFLLFVTPHFVHIANFSRANLTSQPSQHADYTLFFQVSRELYSTNNACNFFLYCLSGTKFRSDLVKLFRRSAYTG